MHWFNRKSRKPKRTSLEQLQADIEGLTESIDYALSLPQRLQKPDHLHAMHRTRGSLKLYRDLHYPMHELRIVCQPCPYCDHAEDETQQSIIEIEDLVEMNA